MEANGNTIVTEAGKQNKILKVSEKFKEILSTLDFDLNDQQIKETPNRWAKMMVNELLIGCYTPEPEITVFENTKKYDEMVFVGPIQIKSMCSHHFVPFVGEAYIAYIPGKKIIGISKFSRIVKWFMRRPQIQEELTKQITDYIIEKLDPNGLAVYIKAQHHCMTIRGVEESSSWMKTSDLRGNFRNPTTRQEFFSMVK